MKVLIVGCGIGGMAAAIEFAKYGDTVQIVEIEPEFRSLGTGISLSPLTYRAFCDLEVGGDIADRGYLHDGWDIFDNRGNLVQSLLSADGSRQSPSEGAILRPELHGILLDKVRSSGANIRFGDTVKSLDNQAGGATVVFASGVEDHYDLVVAADGAYSPMRGMVMPQFADTPYAGQVVWRALLDRPEHVTRGRLYQSERAKMGFNPCSKDKMYMFYNEVVEKPVRHPDDELIAILRRLMAEFEEAVGEFIPQINQDSGIMYRPLEACLISGPWYSNSVVLIGDASHGPTPHLGSGAGLAVEDAVVLPREMHRANSDKVSGLQSFMKRRQERVNYIIGTSYKLGEMEKNGESIEDRNRLMQEAYIRMNESYLA